MLQLFSHDIYYSLDLESTLFDMTPFVAVHFGSYLMLFFSFSISTSVSDCVVTKNVYWGVWYLLVVRRLWWFCLN